MEGTAALPIIIGAVAIYLVIFGLSITSYILSSYSLYKIAGNRGINNPWLAWIPYGTNWIIGAICDFHDEQNGIKRKWRVALLTLSLVIVAIVVLLYISMFVLFIVYLATSDYNAEPTDMEILGILLSLYAVILVEMISALVLSICQTICLYKIFEVVAPTKAIKYILLYTLVPLAGSICLFKCKDSSLGIPQIINETTSVPQETPEKFDE